MARAQENPDTIPSYLEFFGMERPPFARLSVSSQLFHSDQYSILADHLASATERSDFLLVLCGVAGSGKTTLLNRHILNIDEDVSYATFDESCADGTQFYHGLLRQLGFHDISGKLNELKNIAHEYLIHRGMAGDHVLVIIDNAHLVCASVLEQLRLIAETNVKGRRVLSAILAGNSDLPRIMASPAMRKFRFKHHVDFTIRVYSEQETEDYVRHRLRLSGGADATRFAQEAHPVIYRFTGGIPNAINRLCNAVLTEACALDTRVVTGDLIRSVAESHEILPHVVPLQGMGRRKTDSSVSLLIPVQQPQERIIARDPPPRPAFESSAPGSAVADVDIRDLLNQVSQLSGQLAVQTQRTETLSNTILDDTAEIRRLDDALSKTREALQENENASNELTAKADAEIEELERKVSELREKCKSLRASAAESRKEMRAAKKAATAAAKAEAKVEKLEESVSDRDARIVDLQAELDIYIKADTISQPALHDEQANPQSEQSVRRTSAVPAVDKITTIDVLRDGEIEQVMNLADAPSRIMIGRGEDCELRLDSKFVSRHHALIFCTNSVVSIEDLNSFNGTVVNSRKISRCDLYPDDKVTIGDFDLRPRPAVKNDRV
ncbi:MAG: FHA domain-containing protein [Woeseiaceae bacterium]